VEGWQELSPGLSSADTNRASQWLTRGTFARNRDADSSASRALSWQLGYELSLERASGDRIEGSNRQIEDYAAFGSLRWKFAPLWIVQPALRVSYNSAFSAQPVPSIHLKGLLNPSLQLRASYARGFRTPSIKELYLEFVDANHNLYGNPDLQAEYSHHADFGLQWTHSKDAVHRWSVEPSFFYNRVFEQIELAQIDELRYSYVNLASTQSFGVRIEAGYEIHPDFKFRLGASHIAQEFETGSGAAQSYNSPEYSAGFDYWRPSKRFGFQTTYRYQGSTPLVGLSEDGVELGSLEDFHYLECSATEKFLKGRIQWTVGGRNLLDVESLAVTNAGSGVHSGGSSRPMFRGRSFFTSLKIALN
jgi:outer membrane receptor for ferrienterochelin and colicins